jgi:potassium channel subfamily K protein
MKENEFELRRNVSSRRELFIEIILDAHSDDYLDLEFLSDKLQEYEEAAQEAVEGNLQLTNTGGNITDGSAFPVQSEKWTLMQAVFFASTICTTIGWLLHLLFVMFVL